MRAGGKQTKAVCLFVFNEKSKARNIEGKYLSIARAMGRGGRMVLVEGRVRNVHFGRRAGRCGNSKWENKYPIEKTL